jgi:hypothetical protein
MRPLIAPVAVLVCLAAAAFAQRVDLPSRLPERVAVHVGPSGKADRWADRTVVLHESALAWMTVPLIFMGIAVLAVLSIQYVPPSMVSIPNKDYWMATLQRRAEAAAVLLGFFLWLMAAGVVVGMALTEDVVRASAGGQGSMFGLPAVVGCVVFVLLQVGLMMYQFGRVGDRAGDGDDPAAAPDPAAR